MDSIIPNDKMIVKMMTDKGDLQFNLGSKPGRRPGIPHIKYLCLVRGKGRI
jgi:hypothetical protein